MKLIYHRIISRWEPALFYGLLIAGLLPLFLNKYFVTLDGPCHLYSGILLKSLLAGDAGEINPLFRINPFPVPNYFTHGLFAGLGVFLPDFLSEKVVLFIYLFFTPLVFRKLILHFSPNNGVFSWFMILFIHNQNFYFGFFNFSYGILFLFLTLLFFLKHQNNWSAGRWIVLGILLLLTWFSHLMVFLISLALLTFLVLGEIRVSRGLSGITISGVHKAAARAAGILLAATPAIVLTVLYLSRFDSIESNPQRLEFKKLIEWILNIRPLLALRYGYPWKTYSTLLFVLLVLMVFIPQKISKGESGVHQIVPSFSPGQKDFLQWTFLIFAAGFLFLFLIVPNAVLLSERLILFFFLFLVTWLSLRNYPPGIHFATVLTIILFHVVFTGMYMRTMAGYAGDVVKLKEVVKDIRPGSFVLPVNVHPKWVYMHISGYAGSDKPLLVLENYEAGTAWFPVRWDTTQYKIGFLDRRDADNRVLACEKFIHPEASVYFSLTSKGNHILPVPYVLIIRNNENRQEIPVCLAGVLRQSYEILKENTFCILYSLKEPIENSPPEIKEGSPQMKAASKP